MFEVMRGNEFCISGYSHSLYAIGMYVIVNALSLYNGPKIEDHNNWNLCYVS